MPDIWPQQGPTQQVLDVAEVVAKELGWGFPASVYQRAMVRALGQEGLDVRMDVPLDVVFRGEVVGSFSADLVVEGGILVEVRTSGQIGTEDEGRLLSHLKAGGIRVGLILDFGSPRVVWRRMYA